MIQDGSLDMKDALGPVATGMGFTLATVSPAVILQAIGTLIALFGAYYTKKRFIESQRYNDLYHERLKWEKEIHASTDNSKTDEEVKDSNQVHYTKKEKRRLNDRQCALFFGDNMPAKMERELKTEARKKGL